MNAILAGHKGVLCHMDDNVIFGHDQCEHDAPPGCRTQIHPSSWSHPQCRQVLVLTDEHLLPGSHHPPEWGFGRPGKTAAVLQMTTPSNTTELRRFLRMVNQLGKVSPNLAEISRPFVSYWARIAAGHGGPCRRHHFSTSRRSWPNHQYLFCTTQLRRLRSLQMPQHTGWERYCFSNMGTTGNLLLLPPGL